MTSFHLIISHVYTTTQLGKYHHLDIFILDKEMHDTSCLLFYLKSSLPPDKDRLIRNFPDKPFFQNTDSSLPFLSHK